VPEIVVCLKPVPDPKYWEKISLDPKEGSINRTQLPFIVNPLDKHALELALDLKDRFNWRVSTVSMAPKESANVLREALAMGADRAYLISDETLAGSDTFATAHVLSSLIREKIGSFDILICGDRSIDGSTSQVPPQIAEFLEIPHFSHVIKSETSDARVFSIEVDLGEAIFEFEIKPPFSLAVTKQINTPRLINIAGILSAESKPLYIMGIDSFHLDTSCIGKAGSFTKIKEIFLSQIKRKPTLIEDEPEAAADKLFEFLSKKGFV